MPGAGGHESRGQKGTPAVAAATRQNGSKEKGGIEGGGPAPARSGRRLGSGRRAGGACCTGYNLKCCFRRKELKEGRESRNKILSAALAATPSVRPRPSDRVLLIRSGFDCGRRRQKAERGGGWRTDADRATDRTTVPLPSSRK